MSTRRSRAEGLAGSSIQRASLWRGFFYRGVNERGRGRNPKRKIRVTQMKRIGEDEEDQNKFFLSSSSSSSVFICVKSYSPPFP
jgi:hypothetical protein